jgi:hypothetical protein
MAALRGRSFFERWLEMKKKQTLGEKRAQAGARGGKIGGTITGTAKVRGDAEYYRALALESWRQRRREARRRMLAERAQ